MARRHKSTFGTGVLMNAAKAIEIQRQQMAKQFAPRLTKRFLIKDEDVSNKFITLRQQKAKIRDLRYN